jgi:glyoxylase I family protein
MPYCELPEFGMAQLRAGSALIDLVDIDEKSGAWARPVSAGGRNLHHLCIAIAACDEQDLRLLAVHKGYGSNSAAALTSFATSSVT